MLSELFSTFLGALLGVVLGVPAGLVLDRYRTKEMRREQAQAMLQSVEKALESNLHSLKQLQALARNARDATYIPLEVSWWHRTLVPRLEAVADADLLGTLFSLYISLVHLNDLCRGWIQCNTPLAQASTSWMEHDKRYRREIINLAEECFTKTKTALELLHRVISM